ncbi:DUF2591 domain-containing protein [Pseudomonas mosselii]|uniref:phage protein NinX family protein n=1 Tax=Pseudomonas TaxID=286 RepID=UPI00083CF24A|nr:MULTISPECIES: phage protein NinX family protein [Pseudomonas]ODB36355.1 DUF2591 domain-containing protein [Pseudomonas mosselii]
MNDLIQVNTADLIGHALDWAVAKAEGLEVFLVGPQYNVPWRVFWKKRGQALEWDVLYNPHEDWTLGGPLIEKHVRLIEASASGEVTAVVWCPVAEREGEGWGETILGSSMLAIVAAKLGDTVQVPKELMSCS